MNKQLKEICNPYFNRLMSGAESTEEIADEIYSRAQDEKNESVKKMLEETAYRLWVNYYERIGNFRLAAQLRQKLGYDDLNNVGK